MKKFFIILGLIFLALSDLLSTATNGKFWASMCLLQHFCRSKDRHDAVPASI
jgi:hypothetical protein